MIGTAENFLISLQTDQPSIPGIIRSRWIKHGKITKEAFYEWAEEARKRRGLCVKGEISIDDFKLWLEE